MFFLFARINRQFSLFLFICTENMHEAKNVQPKLMHVYKLQKLFISLGGCYHAESLSGYEYMNAGMENFAQKSVLLLSQLLSVH